MKILLLGYLPPPYFGPSVTYDALMKSEFARRCDVTFLDLTVSRRIQDIEKFQVGKLLSFAGHWLKQLGWLMTRRFDFCCTTISANRNAFLKEAAMIRLCRLFGVPVVLYAHGNGFLDFHEKASPRLQRKIAQTITGCTAAIVMGEKLRYNFEPWFTSDRIFVVGTGLVPSNLPARTAKTDVSVLYLGNLVRDKGVFVLLEAAARVVAKRKDVRFVLAGDWFRQSDREEAEAFIAGHGLRDHIRFAGVVWGESKARLMAEGDILAFPTFYPYEAHPLVVVEGLQAGIPVVTTARGAIPEIIEHGVTGYSVEEHNAGALADKILQLADDPAQRARMGAAGRKRFEEFYTHEHYGQRMLQVFQALAGLRSTQNKLTPNG